MSRGVPNDEEGVPKEHELTMRSSCHPRNDEDCGIDCTPGVSGRIDEARSHHVPVDAGYRLDQILVHRDAAGLVSPQEHRIQLGAGAQLLEVREDKPRGGGAAQDRQVVAVVGYITTRDGQACVGRTQTRCGMMF